MAQSPEFVAIGHVTKDLLPEGGHRLGGAVTYAAWTARSLGLSAAVLTSAPANFGLDAQLPGIELSTVPSVAATTFENIYEGESRCQFLHSTADVLHVQHLPARWREATIALLAPVAGELGSDWINVFPSALVAATPQGWMRDVDEDGRVRSKPWQPSAQFLSGVDVLIFSEEDVDRSESEILRYARMARIAAVTRGSGGATVFVEGSSRHVPTTPVPVVDATGAGDIFAAAFLVALNECGAPFDAARFANCAAALSVQGYGIEAIPSKSQVEERLQQMDTAAGLGTT